MNIKKKKNLIIKVSVSDWFDLEKQAVEITSPNKLFLPAWDYFGA